MAEKNSKFVAFVAVLLFAAVGLLVMLFINNILTTMSATGLVKDILNAITTPGLLEGLLWLLVCIVVYIGVGKVIGKGGEKISPISLWFLFLWIGAVLGLFVGTLIWALIQGSQVTIDLNTLIGYLFQYLAFSLGPAFAAALGISNK